ncbi:hypothetical protein V1515DRAFT_589286 [Lipomyces mesembrius]
MHHLNNNHMVRNYGYRSQLASVYSGYSSLTLRIIAPYFVRWLPLGPRFTPLIYTTYRSSSAMDDGPGKTMLGQMQRGDLEKWLETDNGWKVLVSGVPFTRNWRGPEANDSWAGYLWERQLLLEKMWATEGVVICGDRHEHATTVFPSHDGTSKVIEFSTSPLSQFYQPFDRQYRQVENTDVVIYSHPHGISELRSLTFDTSLPGIWNLGFELEVNGKNAWSYKRSRGLNSSGWHFLM